MFWKIKSTLIKEFLIHTWKILFKGYKVSLESFGLKEKWENYELPKQWASNLHFWLESPKVQKWQFQSSPSKELENILNKKKNDDSSQVWAMVTLFMFHFCSNALTTFLFVCAIWCIYELNLKSSSWYYTKAPTQFSCFNVWN